MTIELKLCPFCGCKPPADLIDTLYPSGIWWRDLSGDEEGLRVYSTHSARKENDNQCYRMGCDIHNGGCGVEVTADTKEEVIIAWNRRPKWRVLKWLIRQWKKIALIK